MHLTNYSLNKLNEEGYIHTANQSEILEENKATKRTLTSLWKSLEKRGIDVA